MKASSVSAALKSLVAAHQPAFIWGSTGVGKSSIIAQLASSLNLGLRDIRALLLDPVDLRGLPCVAEGRSKWATPEFLREDGAGILLLDELNAARPWSRRRSISSYLTAGSGNMCCLVTG